ncbi:MAG: serine/threonine protein kinase [Blastococcus sp.]|nr:serine/threonine protein kinase [Blastococcus sp.]
MNATTPAAPPDIPGFVPEESIRSGGFADVFRYRQELTERDVAVKVLKAALSDEGSEQRFVAEANVMARLSTHPYIVTIHLAGVTGDGRPYLVMEYCSRDDLAQRVKRETLSIAEVLRIGVRVAGAVETAHRARVLHRDIKPANILTTDYGNPALTDFGISATLHETAGIDGLSIPWSPPEAIEDPANTSVASDVYSLAATVWHLLVGRSPFALPSGPNSGIDLTHRITNTPVPRIGRPDVPPGLVRALAQAMAKNPADRPGSALELARSLQAVEKSAGYGETTVDILEAGRPRGPRPVVADDEPGTRVRPVLRVDPDTGPRSGRTGTAGATGPTGRVLPPAEETVIRIAPGTGGAAPSFVAAASAVDGAAEGRTIGRLPAGPPAVDDTQVRPRPAAEAPAVAPVPEGAGPGALRIVLVAGAALVVAGGVTAAVLTAGGGTVPPPAASSTSPAGGDDDVPLPDIVPAPTEVAGARQPDGTVLFTWQTPDAAAEDQWVVRRDDPGVKAAPQLVDAPTFTVAGVPVGTQTCIEVAVRRADGRTSASPASGCAD